MIWDWSADSFCSDHYDMVKNIIKQTVGCIAGPENKMSSEPSHILLTGVLGEW